MKQLNSIFFFHFFISPSPPVPLYWYIIFLFNSSLFFTQFFNSEFYTLRSFILKIKNYNCDVERKKSLFHWTILLYFFFSTCEKKKKKKSPPNKKWTSCNYGGGKLVYCDIIWDFTNIFLIENPFPSFFFFFNLFSLINDELFCFWMYKEGGWKKFVLRCSHQQKNL